MNKAFLDFNDKAIASGIGSWEPQLAQDLQSTMKSFIDYARCVEQGSDDEEHEIVPNLSTRVFEEHNANPATQPQPAMVNMNLPESRDMTQEDLTPEDATIAALLGYTSTSSGMQEGHVQSSRTEVEATLPAQNPRPSNWLASELLRQYRVETSGRDMDAEVVPPALSKSPPLPSSYSYHETSFARRLLRTALEGAYRILTNPNTRSEDLFYFCRNTFSWTNRKHCIEWLEKTLSKTSRENLEHWGAPQLHIGGAGLHYPRTGFDMDSSPPPGWAANAPMGPLPFSAPENMLDGSLAPGDLDGEWFDSNDVEQYLQTKGLFLDGQSSYVELTADMSVDRPCEANVPLMGSPTESSRDSNGYPPTPRAHDSILLDGPILEENAPPVWHDETSTMADFDELNAGSLLDMSNLSGAKEASNAGFFDYVAPPLKMSTYSDFGRKYIDVEKFVLSSSSPLLRSFPFFPCLPPMTNVGGLQ